MQIEYKDGQKEKRFYDSSKDMIADAKELINDPQVKKLILWPRLEIPKRKHKGNKK